jgi:RimJ/RimL family protein N-acetyltransferase
VVEDPPSVAWVTGVVWDPERCLAVGRAGFHGPPDADGMVEVGYSIDPQYRRQGYARAALRALLARAEADPGVRTFRATISPGNVASRDLVLAHGLTEVGEQEDDEDGLEIIYELPVDGRPTPPA